MNYLRRWIEEGNVSKIEERLISKYKVCKNLLNEGFDIREKLREFIVITATLRSAGLHDVADMADNMVAKLIQLIKEGEGGGI